MSSFLVITEVSDKEKAQAVGNAFERMTPAPTGVDIFEIDEMLGNWEVSGFFSSWPNSTELALLETFFSINFFTRKILNEDWVEKVQRDLKPVVQGPFMISNSYNAVNAPVNKMVILVEAAMAFGTGHHPTTLGCLRAIDYFRKVGISPIRVADIGCGTGILAIAVCKAFKCRVIATDIDSIAIQTAKININANGKGLNILAVEANGVNHFLLKENKLFDIIFANILLTPLRRMSLKIKESLKLRGFVVLSGIILKQINSVESAYNALGFRRVKIIKIGNWGCLVMKNFYRSKLKNKL